MQTLCMSTSCPVCICAMCVWPEFEAHNTWTFTCFICARTACTLSDEVSFLLWASGGLRLQCVYSTPASDDRLDLYLYLVILLATANEANYSVVVMTYWPCVMLKDACGEGFGHRVASHLAPAATDMGTDIGHTPDAARTQSQTHLSALCMCIQCADLQSPSGGSMSTCYMPCRFSAYICFMSCRQMSDEQQQRKWCVS